MRIPVLGRDSCHLPERLFFNKMYAYRSRGNLAGGRNSVGIVAGVVTESAPGERRVAMVPSALTVFNKTGAQIVMESGAGAAAGFPDSEYIEKYILHKYIYHR